jgi:pimeloyl-ACP methyl ester carboxylesterase
VNYTTDQALAYANGEADYEAEDNRFVLDQLAEMNFQTGNRFFAALDTNHAGAFGHSFGGGVAMQTALTDKRVLGAINYDGWSFGSVGSKGLAKPLLIMYEPYPVPTATDLTSPDAARRRRAEVDRWDQANMQRTLTAHGGYELVIPTAGHMNFADRSLYSPLRTWTNSGTIAPVRAHEIVEAYTLAFFSKLLKGKTEPLLEAVPSPLPDVRYTVYPMH